MSLCSFTDDSSLLSLNSSQAKSRQREKGQNLYSQEMIKKLRIFGIPEKCVHPLPPFNNPPHP